MGELERAPTVPIDRRLIGIAPSGTGKTYAGRALMSAVPARAGIVRIVYDSNEAYTADGHRGEIDLTDRRRHDPRARDWRIITRHEDLVSALEGLDDTRQLVYQPDPLRYGPTRIHAPWLHAYLARWMRTTLRKSRRAGRRRGAILMSDEAGATMTATSIDPGLEDLIMRGRRHGLSYWGWTQRPRNVLKQWLNNAEDVIAFSGLLRGDAEYLADETRYPELAEPPEALPMGRVPTDARRYVFWWASRADGVRRVCRYYFGG